MSQDAVRPVPRTGRPVLGLVLRGAAIAVGWLALVLVVLEIVLTGGISLLATPMRTVLLLGLAAVGFMKGRAMSDPERFGPEAIARDELAGILQATARHTVRGPTRAAGFYADYSGSELVEAYRSIRREAAPDRFDELILEVRRRGDERASPERPPGHESFEA